MDQSETCRSSPPATLATIADDILIEILIRFSTKFLIQLKSVCKQWCSLISGHSFSLLHTLRHRPAAASSALLLRRPPSKVYHLSLRSNHSFDTHLDDVPYFTVSGNIIQSCHGLLLCRNSKTTPAVYYIYNPATRLRRTLDVDRNTAVLGLTLAFDPSKSAFYKVVCLRVTDFSVFCYRIEVFDSKSCSWSIVVENFTAPYDVNYCNGIYWNNAIHWSRPKGDSVYFNVDKGVFGKFPKAPMIQRSSSRDGANIPLLVESGGHLHFIVREGPNLTVYEMERDYSKWYVKYRVGYSTILSLCLYISYRSFCLLGITRRQNDEEALLLFHVRGKVMAYKFSDKSFEELLDLRREDSYRTHSLQFGPCDVHQFVETHAPV